MSNNIKVKNNSIAIIGWHEGSAGRIETWLEKTHKLHIACFVNPSDKPIKLNSNKFKRDSKQFSYPTSKSFKKRPLINNSNWAEYLKKIGINKALITTDNEKQRFKDIQYAKKKNIKLINAIHPTVNIMANVIMKENVILHEGSYIGYKTELYDGVIVDGAYLAHHNVMRECSTLLPGAITGGNVTLGKYSKIYLGAIIANKIKIGENSTIGAGSLIFRNVGKKQTVFQKPSKIVISNNVG